MYAWDEEDRIALKRQNVLITIVMSVTMHSIILGMIYGTK